MTPNNNPIKKRPCELASHSNRDRLAQFIANSEKQFHNSFEISRELNISRKEAGQLLREFTGAAS